MMTPTIPFTGEFSPVLNDPTGREGACAFNPQAVPFFDLRHDDLIVTGEQDEVDIDDYIETQDPETKRAIAEQGKWVADTFYAGVPSLAALRLRAGLSQRELATACGVQQPHVSRWESGRVEPGLIQSRRMARALGVSLDEFAEAFVNSGA